jgi:hypothetical protein
MCGDVVDESNGAEFETEHQVWFRGPPPTKEEANTRLQNKPTAQPTTTPATEQVASPHTQA